jgi:hypothetical protein
MGKLCARGKAAAKRKYKVYPSAYANGYAVQVCKGTKPGAGGKKKTASGYKKGKKKTTAKKRTTRKTTRRTTRRKK